MEKLYSKLKNISLACAVDACIALFVYRDKNTSDS